jgi:MFS family permease
LPRDVWLLFWVLLVNRAGTMVLPFLSLYLTTQRDMSVIEVGRMLGVYGVGSVIGSYAGGWLSDKIGATNTMKITLLANGVAFLAFLVLTTPQQILAGVFCLSLVAEGFRPAVMTATSERTPAALQARAFALLRLAANLGMGIGPAVGGFFALYNYNWLFIADAVTCLVASVVLFTALGKSTSIGEAASGTGSQGKRSPWRDPPFLALLLLVFLFATVLFQIFTTLPLYLRQVHNYRENVIGMLLGFNALLIVVFEMVLIHWTERYARMTMIGIGSLLMCLGMGLMPLQASIPYLGLTIAIWTLGEMLALPYFNAVAAARPGVAQRGRYLGAYNMAYSLAFIAAPVAGTWIYQRYSPDLLWYAVMAMGLPLLLWALFLSKYFEAKETA